MVVHTPHIYLIAIPFQLPQNFKFLFCSAGNQVKPFDGAGYRLGGDEGSDDLQRALKLSLATDDNQSEESYEDLEMKRAIELSLRATSNHSIGKTSSTFHANKLLSIRPQFIFIFFTKQLPPRGLLHLLK